MGCRTRRDQAELVRVAAVEGVQLAVGRSRPGRGAWLCAATTLPCLDRAVHRKAFGRALRADLAADAAATLRAFLVERARL